MPNVSNWDSSIGEAISPEEWSKFVVDHLTHESVVLASGARRIDTASKQIHVPVLTDDGGADWFDQGELIDVGEPVGDELILTPRGCKSLTQLSNEVCADSDPAVLDTVGLAMVRAVALECDRAFFQGGGGGTIGPDGIMHQSPALQNFAGSLTYAHVVQAEGSIAAFGGRGNAIFVSPAGFTTLQLETATDGRPLLQPDASQGGALTPRSSSLGIRPSPRTAPWRGLWPGSTLA